MRAITLCQPWATLVALHAKRVETRGPRFPLLERGDQIAIHAAAGLNGLKTDPGEHVSRGELETRLRLLCSTEPFAGALALVARRAGAEEGALIANVDWNDSQVLPRGAIVAAARIAGVEQARHVRAQIAEGRVTGYGTVGVHERAFGGYDPGDRQAIFLEHVTALLTPVACPGMLGLWTVPDLAAGQVRDALEDAYRHGQPVADELAAAGDRA